MKQKTEKNGKPKLPVMQSLFVRKISADLLAAFKAHCALRGKTMREKITEMLKREIKGEM